MSIVGRALVVLALALAIACDRGAGAPAEPSPAPTAQPVDVNAPAQGPAAVEPAAPAPGSPAVEPAAPAPAIPPPVVAVGRVKAATLRARLPHASWIGDLAWSPDGARLCSGDDGGRVAIWDAERGALQRTIEPRPRRVTSIAYDPTGSKIAVATSTDLRIFDAATGASLADLVGHQDIIFDVLFVGDQLYAVDVRNELRRWDAGGGLVWALEVPTIHKLSAALGPGARTLALGGYGDLEALEVPAVKRRFEWMMPRCRDAPKDPLCAGWKTRQMEEFGHDGAPPTSYKEESPNWYVQSLAFSADGSRLAAGRADGVALVVDTASGSVIGRFVVGDDHGASVALSGDGSALAAGDREGRVVIWEVATRRALEVSREPGIVGPLAFSPDARALAVGGPGQAVTLWALKR